MSETTGIPTNAPRRGLGRGLLSLIPGEASPARTIGSAEDAGRPPAPPAPNPRVDSADTRGGGDDGASPDHVFSSASHGDAGTIPLSKIELGTLQPREHIREEELAQLTESVREHGILQPVIVRPRGSGYEMVAGERRFRAATAAGLTAIPALVREFTDSQALEAALIENLQRENLGPVETARAYRRLQNDFSLSQSEVARRLGRPQPSIANALRLLLLPEEVIESLSAGQITEGHGKAILMAPGEEAQLAIWREVIAKGLSVRETERRAAAIKAGRTAIPRGISPGGVRTDEMVAIESDLTLLLGARTRIRPQAQGKGLIEISYFDQDDLEGIVERLIRREN